jgi:hypothetical protein
MRMTIQTGAPLSPAGRYVVAPRCISAIGCSWFFASGKPNLLYNEDENYRAATGRATNVTDMRPVTETGRTCNDTRAPDISKRL